MLKTLLQHIDGIEDDIVVGMKIPRATPMVYELDDDMKSLRPPNLATGISAKILSLDGAVKALRTEEEEVNAF